MLHILSSVLDVLFGLRPDSCVPCLKVVSFVVVVNKVLSVGPLFWVVVDSFVTLGTHLRFHPFGISVDVNGLADSSRCRLMNAVGISASVRVGGRVP